MFTDLTTHLGLGTLLEELRSGFGGYVLLHSWEQGEFHHDVVLRCDHPSLPGPFLVVSTNCNGGIKELSCYAALPDRSALWHDRCPASVEFAGELPAPLASARTVHWFDPCELLGPEARSEFTHAARERQPGGGWRLRAS